VVQDTITYEGFGGIKMENPRGFRGTYKYAGGSSSGDQPVLQSRTLLRLRNGSLDQYGPAGLSAAGDANFYRAMGIISQCDGSFGDGNPECI